MRASPNAVKSCLVCGKKTHARGLCNGHYWRWWKFSEVKPDEPIGRFGSKNGRYKNGQHQGKSSERTRRSRLRHLEKYAARAAVQKAVREGRLKRQFCEVCGAKAQSHHNDYSKPLEVKWLCSKHHREIHAQTRDPLTGRWTAKSKK